MLQEAAACLEQAQPWETGAEQAPMGHTQEPSDHPEGDPHSTEPRWSCFGGRVQGDAGHKDWVPKAVCKYREDRGGSAGEGRDVLAPPESLWTGLALGTLTSNLFEPSTSC